jgi:acyl dehydratase
VAISGAATTDEPGYSNPIASSHDPPCLEETVTLNYQIVKNWISAPVRHKYSYRDTILYHLGIGANVIETPAAADLSLVWEERLQALPTMASVLAVEPFWFDDPRTGISWQHAVHGEQSIEWHLSLPTAGEVIGISCVEEIFDNGKDKGALVVFRRILKDAATGCTIATLRHSAFLRADGGFGGPKGAPKPRSVPDSAPDIVICLATRPEQALLYRLSGDLFRLHIDSEFASKAGFSQPVLHGLCTYGIAGRAVVTALCEGQGSRLRRFDARFSAPVFPGELITTDIWRLGAGEASFRSRVGARTVISNGFAQFQ